MPDTATVQDVEDLEQIVIILGGVVAGLTAFSIIVILIALVSVHRIFKKLSDMSLVTKTTRLDVRKTLETVENALKRNPAFLVDDVDGSERASPIFTRRMFTPTPLPFDMSILRESGEFEYDRNRKSNPLASQRRRQQLMGPPVPPRRAHSFYGDY